MITCTETGSNSSTRHSMTRTVDSASRAPVDVDMEAATMPIIIQQPTAIGNS